MKNIKPYDQIVEVKNKTTELEKAMVEIRLEFRQIAFDLAQIKSALKELLSK